MSDKPKPGKDKDLRYIRQAMEATDLLFCLLGEVATGVTAHSATHGAALALADAFLLVAEQLDRLSEMVETPAALPTVVIEQNRQVRMIVRQLMQVGDGATLVQLAQAAGNQLRALLVVQEIRTQHGLPRGLVSLSSSQSRKQQADVLDQ
jgi:hypothetical protein